MALQLYLKLLELERKKMKKILIASYKGGVGKSTIANFLGEKLNNAIILNLDIYQDNNDFNSTNTINMDINEDLEEILKDLEKKYKYVIIDAGGFDDKRLYDLDIDLFIFVTRTDYRSIKTTIDTATTLLSKSKSNKKEVMFLINQYENDKELETAIEILQEILNLSEIVADNFYSVAIKKSNAITTAINNKLSLNELYNQNKAAYKKVNENFEEFAKEVREIVDEKN